MVERVTQYVFKTVLIGFIISVVIACIIISFEIMFGSRTDFGSSFMAQIGYYCLYGISLTLVNSAFSDYLNHVVVWRKYESYRLYIAALGSVLITMITIFVIRLLIAVGLGGAPFSTFIEGEKLKYYIVSLLITLFVSLIFHTVYFYKKNQEHKVKEQQIIAGTASAKFESLKSQIDPHFLFNSLNVLSSLIEENPENAQQFTSSLSKIYRYVLEQKDKELTSIAEELEFAKTYMNLLKMRFENSLFYEVKDAVHPNYKVVPLSLQLLLENTVKHNVVSENRPLHIKIYFEDGYLVVENNLQKKQVLGSGNGIGLQNIIDRYRIVTKRQVVIVENKSTFAVKIPVLTKLIYVESSPSYSKNTAYYRAKKRVEELKGFYGNLTAYCLVIPIIIYTNLRFSPDYHWFWFSVCGWGFGLLLHAFNTFAYSGNWENKKIKEILQKENNKQNWT